MPRKVAIIGMSPSAMVAPLDDPEWECWCLAWDLARAHKAARVFEIHSEADWVEYRQDPIGRNRVPYPDHLASLQCPIYMQREMAEYPTSVAYPIDEIIAAGRDYFGSSIAYMLALAWHEAENNSWLLVDNMEEVGIWGVELSLADYHHQRPNLEYWIGRLEQAGVTVHVECPRGLLMKPNVEKQQNGKIYKRYGWIVDDEATQQAAQPVVPAEPFDPRKCKPRTGNVLRG